MATKKATGKTRTGSRRKVTKKAATKKKTATTKKVAKSTAKRAPAKRATTRSSANAKTTTKKTASQPAARAKAPAAKAATTTKKTKAQAPAAARSKKTVRLTTKTRRDRRAAPPAAPDADGYVFINGRRVRMMSVKAELPPARKTPTKVAAPAEPQKNAETQKHIKTKLTKKQLDHFRALLIAKRAELVGDLSAMETQALQSTGGNPSHMPIHMADIGTDTYDQDLMLNLAEAERTRLRELDEALHRIQDGSYGVCQMTGKPIPKARLEAKPWAKYTIEAAREVEKGLAE